MLAKCLVCKEWSLLKEGRASESLPVADTAEPVLLTGSEFPAGVNGVCMVLIVVSVGAAEGSARARGAIATAMARANVVAYMLVVDGVSDISSAAESSKRTTLGGTNGTHVSYTSIGTTPRPHARRAAVKHGARAPSGLAFTPFVSSVQNCIAAKKRRYAFHWAEETESGSQVIHIQNIQ